MNEATILSVSVFASWRAINGFGTLRLGILPFKTKFEPMVALSLQLINGSKIVLKGADNPTSLEGTTLGALIIDEISAIDYFTSLWKRILRPMLSDYQSPAIFISKPRGYNHFHNLAKQGGHDNIIEGEVEGVILDPDFITYRFETEQDCQEHNCGYIKHEEIEAARRQLTEESFSQEYLTRFTKYTGLVHKLFARDIHVIPCFDVPKDWKRIRGGWDLAARIRQLLSELLLMQGTYRKITPETWTRKRFPSNRRSGWIYKSYA
ncbi:MAG TPA: terminase family protein [Patescibacteria group bacterium]|nr:terminase family protein [Patescibacteria group bacterium]